MSVMGRFSYLDFAVLGSIMYIVNERCMRLRRSISGISYDDESLYSNVNFLKYEGRAVTDSDLFSSKRHRFTERPRYFLVQTVLSIFIL